MARSNVNQRRIAIENVACILDIVRIHNTFKKIRREHHISELLLPHISASVAAQMHPKHMRGLKRKTIDPIAYREALNRIDAFFT